MQTAKQTVAPAAGEGGGCWGGWGCCNTNVTDKHKRTIVHPHLPPSMQMSQTRHYCPALTFVRADANEVLLLIKWMGRGGGVT